jgi:tRNA modification GTPase
MHNDTIVAISTANGKGAISIVRMSGKDSYEIAQKAINSSLTPRVAKLTKFYNLQNELIDIPLTIYFKSPNSFTGEDIVEFQCHGGVVVSKLILESLIEFGARVADAGEFSKRAFFNNKIDMSQAEAISKMIETKSKDGVKVLAKQLRGDLADFVNKTREDLIEIMAYVEVNIDYAEEDLPEDLILQMKSRLQNISTLLQDSLNASKRREAMFNGYKIAIIGKPNVGKSSLLNNLLNYNRAIVSNIAGTTRDTIEEEVQIGSHLIKIVDTAGIRHQTNDEIEKIGIERSKDSVENSDIVIVMFDNSREFDSEDKEILNIISNIEKDVFILLNKVDLENNFDKNNLNNFDFIESSQKDNNEKLLSKIETLLDNYTHLEDNILISTRQIDIVSKANNSILESFILLDTQQLELFSYNIQEAINYISKITRPFEHDEMLEKMFGSFCVGK